MNKAIQNPDGEVELTSKMDGMGACLLSDAVAKTAEGMMRLVDANIELDKETIQGLFTLMAHASQNVSDYMDTWMADQYRQQQRQKTALPQRQGHSAPKKKWAYQAKAGMPTRAAFIFRPKKRREGPVERLLIGLRDFAIEKVVSHVPPVFEARWTGKNACPHCTCENLRVKDSFRREIRNISIHGRPSRLLVRCHKYRCADCGRYFNTRLTGIKVWSRTTELLKRNIFLAYNKGVTCKEIADEHRIGVASVERYYHQMMQHKSSHWANRACPRILGIDEHRFTRRQGFATTFCDLARRRVFDVVKGRSAADMRDFLQSLQGRHKVKVVCIDMNSAYRRLVREWFPNARIVADRFHVIRLVNQHFSELCKAVDEKQLAYGRGGMMRLLLTRRDRLTDSKKERLRTYFAGRPDIESLYEFLHDTADLLRVRAQNIDSCRKYVAELLDKIEQLQKTPFAPLRTLGKTLHNWREEVARMFRFTRNNGITEGFHRKMKLIQRRAYGFRNFENYRLRVRVLCC